MNSSLPIAVDLDGTLIKTDLLYEALFRLLRSRPLLVFLLPLWLSRGKAHLKQQIARRVQIDPVSLPYNEALISYLQEQRETGRKVVLATASHETYAAAVSAHLGLFDGVLATGETNLKAGAKAKALVSEFGPKGFSYAGNEVADLEVWRQSAASIVVSHDTELISRAHALAPGERTFEAPRARLSTYIKACRLHQWVKNLLLFVPLLASQNFLDADLVLRCIAAFIAFGFCASSVYVLNDLMDLEADRVHDRKKLRPFAAGTLPIAHGVALIPLLLLVAALIASALPLAFGVTLLLYYVATCLYSFALKKQIVIDVLVLAGLYTCRVVAGGTATGVPISEWLLAFSMFLFLSLAILKRYTELVHLRSRGADPEVAGRGYRIGDIELLAALGGASGFISVLVFALYLNSEIVRSMYSSALLLWGVCPLLLYWISRVWILAHRGEMDDDPIVFAIKDSASRYIGLLTVALFLVATL